MKRVIKKGVRITEAASGNKVWAGYVELDTEVGDLETFAIDMLDPGTGTKDFWVLGAPSDIPFLKEGDLEELRAGEVRRAALAKLSDEELAAIGIKSRD